MTLEPRGDAILWRRLMPILVGATMLQIVVPLTRLATTYQALEIDLDVAWIGVVSATFSLLPIFLTIPIGRFNDRRGHAPTAILGVVLLGAPALILLLGPIGVVTFLVAMAALGIGHNLFATALQSSLPLCSGPSRRDSVIGNFGVAMSLGHALGPLVITAGGVGESESLAVRLLIACLIGTAVAVIVVAILLWELPRVGADASLPVVPIGTLARTRGLIWVILAGSIATATNDLLLVYLPVLGDERGIAAGVIGAMLSLRSAMAMTSRLGFSRLVAWFGRVNLLLFMMFATAFAVATLFLPLPIWAMYVAMAATGFTLGVAGPMSLSLTIQIAPAEARGAALGLRMSSSRVAQFAMPLAAGLLASSTGVAGIFLVIAAVQALVSTVIRIRLHRVLD
jgi:MFS family permease